MCSSGGCGVLVSIELVQEVGAACFDGQSGYHLGFHVKPENPFFGLCLQVGPSVLVKYLVDASWHIDCMELTLLATAIAPCKASRSSVSKQHCSATSSPLSLLKCAPLSK